ncbi:PhzF family phenazine biosynthesis protein [Rickettsiella endosymbiont of Dermanyssus gallinae]|uniref:PhzF family phenazine biosynthesis protein n=1 Tax=Rickettsiella endosymbiont of Dermanyssus gallinae TaxID=2856608 RepID=UPI001C52D013|nr:PhzF family phenazine biosynthesis protein [Rickettsiella endosymbiont of Dermanyssus gallinae]
MPPSKEDIKIINVFSINSEGGNPCAVVDNADHLCTKEMQALATHLNLPETVFVLRNKRQVLLRFFATKKEHPLCYHGALGAAFYLCKLHGVNQIDLASYLELTRMKMRCEDNVASISIPNRSKVIKAPIDMGAISKLLRISQSCIDKNLPCLVASVGNPKLFVPIIDRAILFNINPNLKLISEWCRDNNINGIYAYSSDTEHSDFDYIGRNFNPLFSHQEDIATGTAAAALCQMISLSTPLIDYTFTIEQGANLNSPSKIAVLVTEDALEIKGEAYFSKDNSEGTKNVFQ